MDKELEKADNEVVRDELISCPDIRDQFSFMLLERINQLTDELHNTQQHLEAFKKRMLERTWKLRIERIADFDTNHIYFDMLKRQDNAILEIARTVASYCSALSGYMFVTQYSYPDEPDIYSYHLLCSFNTCVDLHNFYEYLEKHLPSITQYKDQHGTPAYHKHRIMSQKIHFKDGVVDTDTLVSWPRDSLFHFILVGDEFVGDAHGGNLELDEPLPPILPIPIPVPVPIFPNDTTFSPPVSVPPSPPPSSETTTNATTPITLGMD